MGIAQPTGIDQGDLLFAALEAAMVGDLVYYSEGAMSAEDMAAYIADTQVLATILFGAELFQQMGELAEKPGKTDSKINKLSTRNYMIPGKRTSTIELTLNGLSQLQKDYLEGPNFSGVEMTVILAKNEILNADYSDVDTCMFPTNVVIFNGMRWTVDWSAEADGLWTVVISTSMSGSTSNRVVAAAIPAFEEPGE